MNSIFDVIHDIIGDFKDRQNEYSRDTFFTYKATKRAYFMMCLPYFIGFVLGIIFAMVCEFGGAGQLITGEFAAVVGELLVVGVGVLGIADDAYTNGVTRFKTGGRDFGEDRGNAEGKGFLRRFRFVAGGQGQEAGDAVNKFFHKPYNLKLIS